MPQKTGSHRDEFRPEHLDRLRALIAAGIEAYGSIDRLAHGTHMRRPGLFALHEGTATKWPTSIVIAKLLNRLWLATLRSTDAEKASRWQAMVKSFADIAPQEVDRGMKWARMDLEIAQDISAERELVQARQQSRRARSVVPATGGSPPAGRRMKTGTPPKELRRSTVVELGHLDPAGRRIFVAVDIDGREIADLKVWDNTPSPNVARALHFLWDLVDEDCARRRHTRLQLVPPD